MVVFDSLGKLLLRACLLELKVHIWDNKCYMAKTDKLQKGIFGVGLVTSCLLSFTVLLSLMVMASPSELGPAGVTLWFILVLIALTTLFMLLHWSYSRKKNSFVNGRRQSVGAFRVAVVPAGAIVVLLGMSSLGTLTLHDTLLVLGAAFIIEIYLYTTERRGL